MLVVFGRHGRAVGLRARVLSLLALPALIASMGYVGAQSLQPYQEYDKKIRSAEQVGPLKSDLFGDSVNVYDQSTTFSHTDIELSGSNGLRVALTRKLNVRPEASFGQSGEKFGGAADWNIDVPYISGVFDGAYGWNRTSMGATPRCSTNFYPYTQPPLKIEDIWSGYNVNLPGDGARQLIGMPPSQFKKEAGQNWTTSSLDAIGCTPMLSGYPGEGFTLQTTDGVKYYFNVGTTRTPANMSPGSSISHSTSRVEVFLLASRVEDRFGNWVTYTYNGSGHPTAIQSSDGRSITLSYTNGRLMTATTSARTWSYGYAGNVLRSVTLPDQSKWQINPLSNMQIDYEVWTEAIGPGCQDGAPFRDKAYQLQLVHPSGATGLFRFDHQRHYRSGIPESYCQPESNGETLSYSIWVPNFFDNFSLTSKVISGPGLPAALTWLYSTRDAGYQSLWSGNVTPCMTCQTSKVVIITSPDGSRVEEDYGIVFSLNEGKLLGRRTYSAGNALLRSETLSYVSTAQAATYPFPDRYGSRWGGNDESSVLVRPLREKSIVQDGVTFRWVANTFDAYGRPLSTTKSSTLGQTRTDITEYHDNLQRWIMGQASRQTNSNTGVEEWRTVYNANAMPAELWQFGALRQALAYNDDGTVALLSDANGNATTLASWRLGIPQEIVFPDASSMSAVVDDRGWVTSVTDENGAAKTYTYDAMGRIASVAQPTGDQVNWNTTTQAFAQVNSAEYGIPAGHWRQTISTGNARKVSYFDALWRPVLVHEYDTARQAQTQKFQRTAHDHDGRVIFASYPGTSDALTAGTWTEYDALGRKTSMAQDSESGVLLTLSEYLAGFKIRTTDPKGARTVTSHEAFDSPDGAKPVLIEHPEGAYTQIQRNIFGNPTLIRRRNADSSITVDRRYVYDAQQRLCKTIEPETGALAQGYDAQGNMTWSAGGLSLGSTTNCDATTARASARRVDRTYDARNRIKTLVFQDGNGNQQWSYYPDGKPSQVTSANDGGATTVTSSYSYNKRGLVSGETLQHADATLWAVGYDYDANGALSGISYPSGMYLDQAPNALGQPTKAGTYASSVLYYPNGSIKSFTYGNGVTHAMTQNARQLPARVVNAGVLDTSFIYDSNGNVSKITDALDASRTRTMTYDGLDRLLSAVSPSFGGNGTFRYTYDVLDNLRSAKLAGVREHNYWYDASNRMTSASLDSGAAVIGVGYDVQGNVSNRNGVNYRFDHGNRLREAVGKESYRYDGHGRRVQADASSGAILSMYDTAGVLRRQHNRRTGKQIEYVTLAGSIVAEVETAVVLLAPTVTAPASNATGGYTVNWTAITNATRYELRESANAGSSWSTLYSGASRTHAVTSKGQGTYRYQARACQGTSCGNWSASVNVSVLFAPAAAPVLTVPTTGLSGAYSVSWTTVASAATYQLEERVGTGAWASIQNTAATSMALTGKPAGSRGYRVRACNASGCGAYSSIGTVEVIYPSSTAPTISAPASNYTGGFSVSWTSVAGTTSYELEEGANSGAWAQIQASAQLSRAISGKATGSYRYRVRACNAAGCSAYSNTVATSVLRAPVAAPTLTLATNSTTGAYSVSWSAVAAAVEYRLEERVGTGAWSQIHAEGASTRAVSGKANGSYGYQVRACNDAGCSAYSAIKSITVLLVPGVPVLSVPSSSSTGAYTVSWPAVTTSTSYQLDERANAGAWTQVQSSTALSRAVTGKANGTYEYRARACNASGCSGNSPVVASVVTLPPGSAPVLTAPTSSANGAYTVSWASVATAADYRLEEAVNGGAWQALPAVTTLSRAYTGKASGSYAYRIRACNTGGCTAYSASKTTQVLLVPASAPALTVPSSASGGFTVSWGSVTSAATYKLEQQVNGGSWTVPHNAAGTSRAISPTVSGTYTFRVSACNTSGCGPVSGTKSTSVLFAPPATQITYAHQHNYYANANAEYSQCDVRWNASSGATSYELKANGGITLYTGPATSVLSAPNTIQYCTTDYIVRACNSAGCSAWSPVFTRTLTQDPPPDPGEVPQRVAPRRMGGE